MMDKQFEMQLPPPITQPPSGQVVIASERVVVIVGANGSGKTRLGTWIEFNSEYTPAVHRISAQKSLEMPKFSSTSSLERAKAQLLYGHPEGTLDSRRGHRWQNNPNTSLLND